MSPDQHFFLDADGFAQRYSLLAAAGIQFSERRRTVDPTESFPSMVLISGLLVSQHGTFESQLIECEGKHCLVVTLQGDTDAMIGIIDDLERAFAGHLLK